MAKLETVVVKEQKVRGLTLTASPGGSFCLRLAGEFPSDPVPVRSEISTGRQLTGPLRWRPVLGQPIYWNDTQDIVSGAKDYACL